MFLIPDSVLREDDNDVIMSQEGNSSGFARNGTRTTHVIHLELRQYAETRRRSKLIRVGRGDAMNSNSSHRNEQQQPQQQQQNRSTTMSSNSNGSNNRNGSSHRNEQSVIISNIPRGPPGPPSVATTALASEIGSVVGEPINAFLRSVTFRQSDDMDWDIELSDPLFNRNSGGILRSSNSKKITVDSVGGCIALSKIQCGDYLKSINGKRIGPSYNAERAKQLMETSLEKDGILSIAVGNKEGMDVMIQATVVKPKPTMTYEELGLKVWYWGCLCIKSISKDSLFKWTVLKPTDHILSVNDIQCEQTSPEDFAHILNSLPNEVTIVVRRGKQRWSGKFG